MHKLEERKTKMKIKEHDEMMAYLTRKKTPTETKRQETTMERIQRMQYVYDGNVPKPKHMDNKNIYSFEDQPILKNNINNRKEPWKDFVKTGKLPVVTKEESERLKADRRVRDYMLKDYKTTEVKPLKIDITGINTDLNALENSVYAPDPKRPVPKEVELEGIETIFGIKNK